MSNGKKEAIPSHKKIAKKRPIIKESTIFQKPNEGVLHEHYGAIGRKFKNKQDKLSERGYDYMFTQAAKDFGKASEYMNYSMRLNSENKGTTKRNKDLARREKYQTHIEDLQQIFRNTAQQEEFKKRGIHQDKYEKMDMLDNLYKPVKEAHKVAKKFHRKTNPSGPTTKELKKLNVKSSQDIPFLN